MVGARHVIQRQFLRGYDVMDNEEEYEDDLKMYLMEFMLVGCPRRLRKASQHVFVIHDDGGADWEVLGNMVLSTGFCARFRRVNPRYN